MVKAPEEYRWSSAAAHLRGVPDRSGILDTRFWEESGGAAAWERLHGQDLGEERLRALRKCTYAGMPFGEEAFLEEMEERFGRRWRRVGRAPSGRVGEIERGMAVSA